jgi:hypothetical protein
MLQRSNIRHKIIKILKYAGHVELDGESPDTLVVSETVSKGVLRLT